MKKNSRFLIYGLFLGLVASQSLMDLFLALVTLFGIFLAFRGSKSLTLLDFPKWFLLSLPWLATVFIGFLIKAPMGAPIGGAFGDFIWILQLPLLVFVWKHAELNKKSSIIFTSILLITASYAVAIYFLGIDPLQQHWSDREYNLTHFWRTGGLFSNPMALAQSYGPLCALIIPLSLYSIFQKEKLNYLILLTLIITAMAILFTFTRGVWMSLVIAVLIGSFIFSKRLGIMTILTLLISGSILMITWPKFRDRTIQVFDSKKSYDSERLILWKTNWYIFKENPWIGIGYGENKRRLREYFDLLGLPQKQFEGHAHNQFLHFLAGTGIMGLFFYLTWCFIFLKITLNLYKQTKETEHYELSLLFLGLLMAQIAFHFGSLTEANFTISKNRMLLVFIWSFVLFKYLTSKKSLKTINH